MRRKIISLDDDQIKELETYKDLHGTSFAEQIRRLIDKRIRKKRKKVENKDKTHNV